MEEVCEVLIYTTNGVLSFDVKVTCDGFIDRITEAIESGTVVLDTTEGTKLILSAINVVAIEIKQIEK